MSKERSASEVLLSLEDRIENLEGLVRSIDHNVKLLLSRQNAPVATPPAPVVRATAEAPSVIVPTPKERNAPSVEAVEFVQEEQENPSKKRVVQEKLTYADGKVIILAQVEVFDINGKLADKRKTNNAGKWTSSLLPGKYTIRVAKQRTSLKPQVTGQYEIVVPPGDKPLQLESRKL